MPNFSLGRFPLASADFWTSDHLSERSRSVGAVSETRARGTLTSKRRCITLVLPWPVAVAADAHARGRQRRDVDVAEVAERQRLGRGVGARPGPRRAAVDAEALAEGVEAVARVEDVARRGAEAELGRADRRQHAERRRRLDVERAARARRDDGADLVVARPRGRVGSGDAVAPRPEQQDGLGERRAARPGRRHALGRRRGGRGRRWRRRPRRGRRGRGGRGRGRGGRLRAAAAARGVVDVLQELRRDPARDGLDESQARAAVARRLHRVSQGADDAAALERRDDRRVQVAAGAHRRALAAHAHLLADAQRRVPGGHRRFSTRLA